MTRYDPFAYGNVKLDEKAAGGQAQPEDLLFADAGPVKQAAPAAEATWGLLDEDVGSLLPGSASGSIAAASAAAEFGADILGEVVEAVPAAKKPAPAARPRAAAPRPASGPMQRPNAPSSGAVAGRQAQAVSPTQAAPVAVTSTVASPSPAKPAVVVAPRRGRPMAALLVPLVLCVGGGTGASWLLVMQQNPVMAGIAGLLTLVSATFAWLLLRG